MEAVQTAEAGADGSHESHDQPPLQRCVFSADGAMISLVHTQWAETRTVAVGELEEQLVTENKQEIHVGHLSYFSRLADASTFTTLAEVEMQRRKVGESRKACAVMDGADWLQTFTDKHRPDALRILDFPHAAEHVTKLLEALEYAGMQFSCLDAPTGAGMYSNIVVPVLFWAWLIVSRAIWPSTKGSRSTWTTCANERC